MNPIVEKVYQIGIMGYFTGQETFDNVKNTVTAGYMYNQAVEYDSALDAGSSFQYCCRTFLT